MKKRKIVPFVLIVLLAGSVSTPTVFVDKPERCFKIVEFSQKYLFVPEDFISRSCSAWFPVRKNGQFFNMDAGAHEVFWAKVDKEIREWRTLAEDISMDQNHRMVSGPKGSWMKGATRNGNWVLTKKNPKLSDVFLVYM